MKQFLNQVNVCQYHSTAAVPLQLKLIQCVSFAHVLRQVLQVLIPFVTNDFSARETAHWDDLPFFVDARSNSWEILIARGVRAAAKGVGKGE